MFEHNVAQDTAYLTIGVSISLRMEQRKTEKNPFEMAALEALVHGGKKK